MAVMLSAFLLFMVQPLISKTILPVFGGSFMVWGACMVFFQAVLLAGYVYAHLAVKFWGHAYARWHWVLLATSLLLPVLGWGTAGGTTTHGLHPFPAVLLLLAQSVGWPAFILSATSPLLQRWFSDTDLPGRQNPYALFAASNAGSLVGLLGYPAAMEPLLDLGRQFHLWWVAVSVLVVLLFACGRLVHRPAINLTATDTAPTASVPRRTTLSWFLLGAAACTLFMAATNVITMDIAPVPLLWVLPLAAYLVAFILAFKNNSWRPAWLPRVFPWVAMIAVLLCLLSQMHLSLMPLPFVAVHLLLLFAACWVCATRLADLRPANHAHLTAYYLVMSFGGLVGGVCVVWIAPLVSTELAEFPCSYALTAVALAIATDKQQTQLITHGRWRSRLVFAAWAGCLLAGLLLMPWLMSGRVQPGTLQQQLWTAGLAVPVAYALRAVAAAPMRLSLLLTLAAVLLQWTGRIAEGSQHATRSRNFYGTYRVYDKGGQRVLQHGSTQHGRQYLEGPESRIPAGYYHPSAPAGQLMLAMGQRLRAVGMIGLGTGAMAWYGQAGSLFHVFELDPDGLTVAEKEFSYLNMARLKGVRLAFTFGDGRLSLRNEAPASLDLLLLDAFNSGSIPTHLLTVEAMTEYLRVLRPDGILLLHVSNRNLDLQPVIAASAMRLGLRVASKTNDGLVEPGAETCEWMVVTRRDGAVMDEFVARLSWREWKNQAGLPRPWTDGYSNILGALSVW